MAQISPKLLIPESFQVSRDDITGQLGLIWELIKTPLIVPLLQLGVYICLAMSLMLFMERVYMGIVIILVKLFWKKPEKRYKFELIQDDVELGSSNFPVVLIQIPMFNEKEVCFFSSLVHFWCFSFLGFLLLTLGIGTGLQDLHWSSLWTFMAVGSSRDPSTWRFNWPCNQGKNQYLTQSQNQSLLKQFSIPFLCP